MVLSGCLSGAGIVEKYYVHFIYDVDAYLTMLDKVEALTGKCLIFRLRSRCGGYAAPVRPQVGFATRDGSHTARVEGLLWECD